MVRTEQNYLLAIFCAPCESSKNNQYEENIIPYTYSGGDPLLRAE